MEVKTHGNRIYKTFLTEGFPFEGLDDHPQYKDIRPWPLIYSL